jgi:hypothetical protein
MNSQFLQFILIFALVQIEVTRANLTLHLRGDPAELLPLIDTNSKYVFRPLLSAPTATVPQIQLANSPKILPTKGETADLLTEETRYGKKGGGRQSYNRVSKPRRTNYNQENRHSDGKKSKDGSYHGEDSYNGRRGYSTYESYDRANRDGYGNSDHKQYGNKDGKHGGGGGSQYGGSTYGGHHDSY